jgi:DsbC/DsbD-like thiol-disulfide interchange protein
VITATRRRLCAAAFLLTALGAASGVQARQGRALPISFAAGPGAARGTAGATIRLELTARIGEGWHLYSLTQPPPPDPTAITLADGQAFALSGAIEAPVPQKGFDEAQGAETEYYTDQVTFRIPVRTPAAIAPGDYAARVVVTWQACNGSLCLRPQTTTVDVPVQVQAGNR